MIFSMNGEPLSQTLFFTGTEFNMMVAPGIPWLLADNKIKDMKSSNTTDPYCTLARDKGSILLPG
jgi:hypothetical protein